MGHAPKVIDGELAGLGTMLSFVVLFVVESQTLLRTKNGGLKAVFQHMPKHGYTSLGMGRDSHTRAVYPEKGK